MVQKKKSVAKKAKKVVVQQPKAKRPRPPRPTSSVGSFAAAVRAPFSRAAEGARLPDGNPNLSTTIILTTKQVLAASADGTLDCVILPNLSCQMFTTRNAIANATSLLCADTSTTVNVRTSVLGAAQWRGVGAPVASLQQQFNRYRVVSYGVRLRSTTGVSSSGEFTLAALPLKGHAPILSTNCPAALDGATGTAQNCLTYWGYAGPRSTVYEQLAALGLPVASTENTAAIDIAKLVNLPCHSVISAAQCAARGVHMRGLPYESEARNFISTNFVAVGTDSWDIATDNLTGTADATQQYGVDMSFLRVAGHESLVISGTGFATGAVASVEVVYHIEALPNPQYAIAYRPSGVVPIAPSRLTLDQALATLHRIPRISFADVVQTVGDTMMGDVEGRVVGAASSAVSNVAGMLSRLLMAGA